MPAGLRGLLEGPTAVMIVSWRRHCTRRQLQKAAEKTLIWISAGCSNPLLELTALTEQRCPQRSLGVLI